VAPIIVPLKPSWRENLQFLSLPANLLIIDPSLTLSEQKLSHEPPVQTQFIANSTHLLSSRPGGTWQSTELKKLPGFTNSFEINQTNIKDYVKGWNVYLTQFLLSISLILPFILPFFFLISRLWITLLDSAMIYFFSRLMGKPFPFLKIWQLSWHIAVPAELVQQLTNWFFPGVQHDIYNLTFWILFAVLMYELRNVKAVRMILKGQKD
jgi:hypothetical protein